MSILKVLFRISILALSLCLFCALLGLGMGGPVGAVIGGSSAGMVILILAACSESLILRRVFRAKRGDSQVERSLQLKLFKSPNYPDMIYYIHDPIPIFQPLKSLGTRGKIVISSGLLTVLNDEDIKSLIRSEAERLRSSFFTVTTVCLAMSRILETRVPPSWKKMEEERLRTPVSLWKTLIVMSLAQFFSDLARDISLVRPSHFDVLMKARGFNPVFAQSETSSRLETHTFLSI